MEASSSENWTSAPHTPANSSCDYQFCGQSVGIMFSASLHLVDITLGLPSNARVLWLIGRGPGGLDQSEIFTLNLAVMEMAFFPIFPLSVLNFYILCSPSINTAMFVLYGMVVAGRPLFQCCICVERYLAVLRPLTFLRYKPLRYRLRCLAVVWAVVLGFGGINYAYKSIYILAAVFVVLLLVDSFCSLSILRALRCPRPGQGQREGEEPHLAKRRAFRTIVIIQVMMVVNYLPIIISVAFTSYVSWWVNICVLGPVPISLSTFGSFVHPLCYLAKAGRLPCARAHSDTVE